MDNELRGVRGWLALLAVILFVIGPLRLVFSTLAELSAAERANFVLAGMPSWENAKAVAWGFTALQIVCAMAGGWLLMTRFKRSTVTIVIALIWLYGPLLSPAAAAAMAAVLGVDIFSVVTGSDEAKNLIFPIIWTAYLKRSVRVRNTYCEDAKLEQLGDTFT